MSASALRGGDLKETEELRPGTRLAGVDSAEPGAYNLPCVRLIGYYAPMSRPLPFLLAVAVVLAAASPALAALCAPPAAGAMHGCCAAGSGCATPGGERLSRCCMAAPADDPAAAPEGRTLRVPLQAGAAPAAASALPALLDAQRSLLSGAPSSADSRSIPAPPLRL